MTFTNTSIQGRSIPATNACDTSGIIRWAITPSTGHTITTGGVGTNVIIVRFNTPGTYQIRLIQFFPSSICSNDTIIKTIIVKDTTRKDSSRTICRNKPIVFNGQTLNTSGIYRDTFVNSRVVIASSC